MVSKGSVSHWLSGVKAGDQLAAQRLWERYFTQMVRLCRKKLARYPRRAVDEEDVALSAFESFCQRVRRGQFPQLRDRDNLWRLLVVIAARKAVDQIQHEHRQKRGGGRVRGESAFAQQLVSEDQRGIEQVVGEQPTPEFAMLVAEQCERLLVSLPDETMRSIVRLKLEGYTNQEIALRLNRSRHTVQLKLRLIREKWSQRSPGND